MHSDLIWAKNLIRNQRELAQLPYLEDRELTKFAVKYLVQKGYFIPQQYEDLPLRNGVYTNMTNAEVLQRDERLFPYDPQDPQEFWCNELGSLVVMSGNLDGFGTYLVKKLHDPAGTLHPVKGKDLIPKDAAEKPEEESEFLKINKASWGAIKNFIEERFINSYIWQAQGEKTAKEIRKEMIDFNRSNRNGASRLIDNERKSERGYFDTQVAFTNRMSAIYKNFPWSDLSILLDYQPPRG